MYLPTASMKCKENPCFNWSKISLIIIKLTSKHIGTIHQNSTITPAMLKVPHVWFKSSWPNLKGLYRTTYYKRN